MNIRKIGYGRVSVHDFESSYYREYCYMEADLEAWEGIDESLKLLRGLVNSKVGIHEDIYDLEARRDALNVEINHLEARKNEAREQWDKIDAFMKRLGVNVEFDPIPF